MELFCSRSRQIHPIIHPSITKRSADRSVDHGTDILNASIMDVLKKTTNVEVFTVSEDEMSAIDSADEPKCNRCKPMKYAD
jgi:hypothetical protein